MTDIPHHHHDHDEHHNDHDHKHDHHHHPPTRNIFVLVAMALHLPGFGHDHQHGHGLEERMLEDNNLGIRTVWLALFVLGITTVLQVFVYMVSGSVALLADTVHNFGDALNSVPLLVAFYLARRSATKRYTYGYNRAEDIAGVLIVVSIAFSAGYILFESFQKLLNPQPLENLGWLAGAAIIGFIGNEIVAVMQIRVGKQIGSDAMVADGQHARVDGLTSLAVLVAVVGTWIGVPILDPIIGIVIGVAIVGITWNAIKSTWFRLMDAVDPTLTTTAEAVILEHTEVKTIQRLQMRWQGHRLHGEAVIQVHDDFSLKESDTLVAHLIHHFEHALPNLGQFTIQVRAS